jgi:hypothetical protein
MLADPTGTRWYAMIQKGGQDGVTVAPDVISAFSRNQFPPALASLPGSQAYRNAWEIAIQAADRYNEPGRFTAFIGYEWTSNTNGNNLHRVVIFRDGGNKARMVEPYTTLRWAATMRGTCGSGCSPAKTARAAASRHWRITATCPTASCHRLASDDRPVAEIAFDLGCADAANFTRAFRRRAGVSPRAFRAQAGAM